MASPHDVVAPRSRVTAVGLSSGGTSVTVTLSTTTIPDARALFGDLRRALDAGELGDELTRQLENGTFVS